MLLRRLRFAAGILLVLCANGVLAAPGFIRSANVMQDGDTALISVQFACRVEYIDHLPIIYGDRLRVNIDSTGICSGAAPTIANSRMQYRPLNADLAKLLEIAYDGESLSNQTLTLVFSEVVQYVVLPDKSLDGLSIRVRLRDTEAPDAAEEPTSGGVRVQRPAEVQPDYVINLSSSRNQHTAADHLIENLSPGLSVFETEVVLGADTWYRLRVGTFSSTESAQRELSKLLASYPTAWVDRAEKNSAGHTVEIDSIDEGIYASNAALAAVGLDQVDELMADARRAMVAGELSMAVQIYTKVLRVPNHDRHAEAQELLGLARQKNGQTAHATAEYQRYLSLYPDGEGANRVSQRLAALLATDRVPGTVSPDTPASAKMTAASRKGDWRVQTYVSQYYRRDANQVNEEEEIISQSALFSDINLDARRRGERFDFSSRLSAGYRSDFLPEDEGSGDEIRVSYAYADLADNEIGLRGRIGRQSRNTGGVLGRFDGLDLSYRASERILVSTVFGQPVNSASDGLESEKTFYGASIEYGPIIENLELGMFFIQQDIEGMEDRQAVGTEFRYFGDKQSIWGLIDYDTSFKEISSAFLQGSWRITPRLNVSGSFDHRHTPYLSAGSALIGQPVETFSELLVLFSEEEIRQFSLDRTPLSDSYTLGVSYSISPKLQINVDANQTTVDAAPESGGVAEMPEASYTYFSTTLIASSVFKEGDSTMIGLRYSDSNSAQVTSLTVDSRFPVGTRWRINPRLRIDQRQILSDSSDEWQITPGLRVQYRHSRKFRVEFEAGKLFSQRALENSDLDRESYFLSLGYQVFF
jgi:hypothetical protein